MHPFPLVTQLSKYNLHCESVVEITSSVHLRYLHYDAEDGVLDILQREFPVEPTNIRHDPADPYIDEHGVLAIMHPDPFDLHPVRNY